MICVLIKSLTKDILRNPAHYSSLIYRSEVKHYNKVMKGCRVNNLSSIMLNL